MRRYTADEEERIRTSALVREWRRSGLLPDEQAESIDAALKTDLKRTNLVLRAVLFVFGGIVLLAAFGLALATFGFDNERTVAVMAIGAGIVWFVVADYLVAVFRLYRFGVEEAFAVAAVASLAGGVGLLVSADAANADGPLALAMLIAAGASAAVYLRFGHVYAAVAAVACAALAPFALFADASEVMARLLAAAVLLGAFAVAVTLRRRHGDDYPGDDYGAIESASWAGVYIALNVRLFFDTGRSDLPGAFYWATYAAIWLLPAVGLAVGLRGRHRLMIRVNMVLALATLATNKLYLGAEQHAWDPILLGVLLIGAAIAIRQWLARGPGGQRHGYTPQRVLASDSESLAAIGMAAGAAHPVAARHPLATEPASSYQPGGGQSGGAGASGKF